MRGGRRAGLRGLHDVHCAARGARRGASARRVVGDAFCGRVAWSLGDLLWSSDGFVHLVALSARSLLGSCLLCGLGAPSSTLGRGHDLLGRARGSRAGRRVGRRDQLLAAARGSALVGLGLGGGSRLLLLVGLGLLKQGVRVGGCRAGRQRRRVAAGRGLVACVRRSIICTRHLLLGVLSVLVVLAVLAVVLVDFSRVIGILKAAICRVVRQARPRVLGARHVGRAPGALHLDRVVAVLQAAQVAAVHGSERQAAGGVRAGRPSGGAASGLAALEAPRGTRQAPGPSRVAKRHCDEGVVDNDLPLHRTVFTSGEHTAASDTEEPLAGGGRRRRTGRLERVRVRPPRCSTPPSRTLRLSAWADLGLTLPCGQRVVHVVPALVLRRLPPGVGPGLLLGIG
mmetsp:Transcript_30679/g.91058  ORF Transcript_30679/g.91058 Transcript_30679/m.91058 type:complete len:398 (-) Transcript_30679:115-1308(-)